MDTLRIQELDPNKVYVVYVPTADINRLSKALEEKLSSFGITKVIFISADSGIKIEEKLDDETEEHWFSLQNS